MRPLQWVAVALAAAGVLVLTFVYGSVPWIALTLALSFGTSGLVKKRAPLGSMYGLTIETAILLVPAAAYLFYVDRAGHGAFLHAGARTTSLLAGAGLVTTIPLLLFASAAQRIPLSLLGVFQYIAPTLQLLTGVLVYREPFTRGQFIGFAIVWTGLVVFGIDGWLVSRAPSIVAVLDEGAG
jgi:chloramphenicol-sensitive protein RarD